MVPMDQRENALDLFTRFMKNNPFGSDSDASVDFTTLN